MLERGDLIQIRLYLTASETMSQLQCKCCSKEVHPGRGDYYLVRIDAVADPQPPIITQEDLDQDIGAEIERLIRRMKSMSEQQLDRPGLSPGGDLSLRSVLQPLDRKPGEPMKGELSKARR